MFELEQKKDALQKVYLLCEEKEEEGVRNFRILAVGQEKADLIPLMEAKLEKDEFGLFGTNGVEYQSNTAIQSRYNDDGAGVEYYILEEPLLTREQLQAKLQTKEYETSFHHPDNLGDILTSVFRSMVDDNYPDADARNVADHIMQNKSFQSMIKRAWWASGDHIDERTSKFATNAIYGWLYEYFTSHPDFFAGIAEQTPFVCSGEFRNLLIDVIYDISKKHRLWVTDVEFEANRILEKSSFRAKISPFCLRSLRAGSEGYERLVSCCRDFVESQLVPEDKRDPKKPSIDALLKDATIRKTTLSGSSEKELDSR